MTNAAVQVDGLDENQVKADQIKGLKILVLIFLLGILILALPYLIQIF